MHRSQEWVRPGGCNGGDKEERREVRARRNKTVFSVSTIPSVQRTLGWLAEKCNRFSSHSISTTVNALAPWRRSGDILLANDRWFYSPEREPRSMRWIIYIVSRVSRDCIYIIEGIPGAPLSWIKSSTDPLDSHGDLQEQSRYRPGPRGASSSYSRVRFPLNPFLCRPSFALHDFGVRDSRRTCPLGFFLTVGIVPGCVESRCPGTFWRDDLRFSVYIAGTGTIGGSERRLPQIAK